MLEIFFTVRKIWYMIIAVIGVPVNLVAITILSRRKCGLSTCTTRYLVAMATADLLTIIFDVTLWQISYYYFPGTFLDITPVCSAISALAEAATDCSVWFTVMFTFDRFVAICCQKRKAKYCTGKTAAVVLTATGTLLCFINVPYFFIYHPAKVVDNIPWDCIPKPGYYQYPVWVGYRWLATVLSPLLPFVLILLFNALTVRHILVTSRVRKRLRGQSKAENRSDPEMESRRRSVILLLTISGSFIILWSVTVAEFLYYTIAGLDPNNYNDSEQIFVQSGYMLLILSCCTNTFIYGITQSKFREQFISAAKYPLTSIIQLINNQNV
ncbi:probable G-protein coupled receptor 139 [Hypanus sabinus]|uniref:probable G-protein coupled receptor 139 n=1 Tax=Hypanus sabinus TaxID=79690 RepID=UPI0028C3B05E|nr:probable G-protein coupled receptor 139 [Hypanus sabinus]XP_059815787.1 probable G-protein coupled receptor 139 [Hypanus sabinus]XP_059817961.1 probable G-protein coupled receptor 139 [Hypanus sabinus]